MRGEVKAPIAGSVWSHVAAVGQHVDSGTTLLLLEVMKTEIPVESTASGTVTWLRPCGESVEVDDLVATVETA
jgi:acetyl-CoA carboxylase biotin carboxyl carrier protein